MSATELSLLILGGWVVAAVVGAGVGSLLGRELHNANESWIEHRRTCGTCAR